MEVKTGNTNEDRAEMNKSPRDLEGNDCYEGCRKQEGLEWQRHKRRDEQEFTWK